MLIGEGYKDEPLPETRISSLVAEGLARLDLRGKRVLAIIPDGTRTAPTPLVFRLFGEALGGQAAALPPGSP